MAKRKDNGKACGEVRAFQRGQRRENGGKDLVFALYCDNWLRANDARLKESSSAKYRADIANHINPFFGNLYLYEITSEDVDCFSQTLLYEKGLAAKTVRDILALFHSIFHYAGKRSRVPLPELEIIYPRGQRGTVRILDKGEEAVLIRFLAKDMDLCKFGVYLALRTGLRIGEVCALKWEDISLTTDSLSVCRTAQRIRKFNPEAPAKTEVVVGNPKTDSSRRMIPLMPDLIALCARFAPGNAQAFVLTGTCQCMEPRKLQRRLKEYTAVCQIHGVHFHTLRHTFATRCVEAGFDPKTLSEILGHSNISITLNRYVHPDMEQKRENMRRLQAILCF